MQPAHLKCVLCGKEFFSAPAASKITYTCGVCGVDGTLDVIYDFDKIKRVFTREKLKDNRDATIWRYADILPVINEKNIPKLAVGGTPLYKSAALEKKYGVRTVYIKDDGRNPTGSLKDRASAVCVAKALDFADDRGKIPTVACASTGNAASSLAGFAAVAGLKSYIFVPESAPPAKVTQLLVYGAKVVLVEGDYSDAFNLASSAIERFSWYNRNCAINPYLVEGKKTCALEIAEQLYWNVPDRIFISVGDGCCISGIYKGFSDLLSLGFVDKIPKITGVQAEGAAPIYKAFKDGAEKVVFSKGETVADSISVGSPRNWAKALRAVRESGGDVITVSDDEILSAIPELARETGVFGEPAGAAAFAGFSRKAAENSINDETAVIVITGNGLKDIAGAQKAVKQRATRCVPDIEIFTKLIEGEK